MFSDFKIGSNEWCDMKIQMVLPFTYFTGLCAKPTTSVRHLRETKPIRDAHSVVITETCEPLSNNIRIL